MPRRTIKRGKRTTRKMGGRKGKKGSRKMNKNHRKMRGGGLFGPDTTKIIDWNNDFEADRKATSLGGMIYHITWNATNSTLILDFAKLGRTLQSVFGIKDKIKSLLMKLSPEAAAKLDTIAGVKGPLTGHDYGGWSRNNIIIITVTDEMISSITLANYANPNEKVENKLFGDDEAKWTKDSWTMAKQEFGKLYQDGLLVMTPLSISPGPVTDGPEP